MLNSLWQCKAVIAVLLLQTVIFVRATENHEVHVGYIMMIQLTKSSFFSDTDAFVSDPVRYIASEVHRPDPPQWLHFVQRDATKDGFLYGTPRNEEDTTSIEVVAINERTQQTAYNLINITVERTKEDLSNLSVAEIWVDNFNVEEILKGQYIPLMSQKLSRLWGVPSDDIRLVKVVSIPTVTGRIPVPNIPGEELKEGVILQFGSMEDFSKKMKSIILQTEDGRCDVTNTADVMVDNDRRFSPDFDVDWCKFKLISPVDDVSVVSDLLPLAGEALAWSPAGTDIPRRDFFLEFILTVIVPMALGVIMFIIISIVMFGGREGRNKRDSQTSETQLMQYHTIRQATNNLRYMSSQREALPTMTPRLGRTPAGTPGPSAVNTLSRPDRVMPRSSPPPGQAPPPYRPPPTFPNTDTGATNWSREVDPIASGSQNEPAIDDDQHLVPQGSPETLKVRK